MITNLITRLGLGGLSPRRAISLEGIPSSSVSPRRRVISSNLALLVISPLLLPTTEAPPKPGGLGCCWYCWKYIQCSNVWILTSVELQHITTYSGFSPIVSAIVWISSKSHVLCPITIKLALSILVKVFDRYPFFVITIQVADAFRLKLFPGRFSALGIKE